MAVLFFGALGALALWRDHRILQYFFLVLALIGAACFIMPRRAAPLYRGWMAVARTVNLIVTAALMTLVYYFAMTPMGLLKRLFGGAPLALKPDPRAMSYWVKREEPAQPKERFLKRY